MRKTVVAFVVLCAACGSENDGDSALDTGAGGGGGSDAVVASDTADGTPAIPGDSGAAPTDSAGGPSDDSAPDTWATGDSGVSTDTGFVPTGGSDTGVSTDTGFVPTGGSDTAVSTDTGSVPTGGDTETQTGDSGTQTDADTGWVLQVDGPPDTATPSWTAIANPVTPSAWWRDTQGPLPTNTWWMGLVLDDGTGTVFPYPYYVRAEERGVAFGLPYKNTTATVVATGVGAWMSLGCAESVTRSVGPWDPWSVTVEWRATQGTMRVPLVAGMPYVSAVYDGLTPVVGLSGLEGTGTRFVAEQGGKTYVVYTSAPVTFASGVATGPFAGTVRVAQIPDGENVAVWDAHADAVPTGAEVALSAAGDVGEITVRFAQEGAGDLFLMALPHHVDQLVAPKMAGAQADTVVGTAVGVVGNTWRLRLPLSPVSFRPPRSMDPTMVEAVRAALLEDAGYDPAMGDSVYWSGKALTKLARLVLIADELGETAVRDSLLERLSAKVVYWLGDGGPLAYDTTWKGVVNGCVTEDTACDFGQGTYNDHHFHYGYHVYAAAVVALFDAQWAALWKQRVGWLLRDYANPYPNDPHFPQWRVFDFYVGHSWASGLTNFASGKNQESTSEAVHAYYAMQLWGEATQDDVWYNTGRILRAAETAAAQRYWQIRDDSDIYDAPFADNPVVGILWNDKVDYATWFGLGDYGSWITGIQIIPVTPATEDLIAPQWVADAWDRGLRTMAENLDPSDGWRDFIAAAVANWDRDLGCALIAEQTGHDGGNSKSNMLHYCATRP